MPGCVGAWVVGCLAMLSVRAVAAVAVDARLQPIPSKDPPLDLLAPLPGQPGVGGLGAQG